MKFCSKCGKELLDEAVICMGCGCATEDRSTAKRGTSVKMAKPKPPYRSLSVIPMLVFAVLAVVFLFCGSFMKVECEYGASYWTIGGTFYDLLTYKDLNVMAIPVVILMLLPVVFSALHFFLQRRAFGWIGFSASVLSYLAVGVFPCYLFFDKVLSYSYYGGYYNYYSGNYISGIKSVEQFDGFAIIYFVEVALLLLMGCVALFDAIGKPLLKIKVKSTEVASENTEKGEITE